MRHDFCSWKSFWIGKQKSPVPFFCKPVFVVTHVNRLTDPFVGTLFLAVSSAQSLVYPLTRILPSLHAHVAAGNVNVPAGNVADSGPPPGEGQSSGMGAAERLGPW